VTAVVVDTSVLVDHLRGDARARDALLSARAQGSDLAASVLTRIELLAGVRPRERHELEALFTVLRWIDVDPEIADRAGALANSYLASHRDIDTVHYVIAATAEALGAELLTKNVKHFPMIAGLRALY
jgi:predicted nucleic acid-binding protein